MAYRTASTRTRSSVIAPASGPWPTPSPHSYSTPSTSSAGPAPLPQILSVDDLLEHGTLVSHIIRERGAGALISASLSYVQRLTTSSSVEDDELVQAYESGRLGKDMPQGSIKAFRQYADYMSLSSPPIPIWPITPLKVAFFLLFRLLMGDVANGSPLRDQYLRGLARALEHFREDTARRFLSRWPEAAQLILRDGRGAPEGRNDLTHDILRICKLGYSRKSLETVINVAAVDSLVCNNNPNLLPDAWATRRRLSSRWVRDREAANLPERQYAGGKFVGEPPKPPPLSGRSTRWNRHLHDLRAGSEETSWVASPRQRSATVTTPSMKQEDEMDLDESPTAIVRPRSSAAAPPVDLYGREHPRPATTAPSRPYALSSPFRGGRLPTPASLSSSPIDAPAPSQHQSEPGYVFSSTQPSPPFYAPLPGGPRRRSLSAGGAMITPPHSTASSTSSSGIYKPTIPSLNDVGIHPSSFPYAPLTPPSSASTSASTGRSPIPWGVARTATYPVFAGGHRRQNSTETPYSCERSTSTYVSP